MIHFIVDSTFNITPEYQEKHDIRVVSLTTILCGETYVETDIEIRKNRFLKRAYTERNQPLEEAKKHWEYILGAGEKYVQPSRNEADIILNGDTNLAYFCQILEYIHAITNNFEC